MTERIKLVQNDTGPQIRITLTDQVTGEPIGLAGATVTVHFRASESDTVLFSRLAYIPPNLASTGVCFLVWNEGDLDREPGDYEAEVEVVRSTGERETIYEMLKFRLRGEIA